MNRMIISLLAFLCCFSSNVWSVNSSREKGVMRVMSYNVRNCRGLDDQTDYKRIAKIISQADPDVISIQELDSVTTRNNGLFALGELAKLTRMHLVYAPAIDYQGGKYGIGILSKEKPLHTRTYSLPGREERRALLVVEFEKYLFCATHFTLTDEDQIASIPILLNALKGVTKPVFLAGDMNSEYFSATQRALREHFQMLNDPAKNTFPANAPDCCIDYIYALKSNATTFSVIRNEVLEEKVASDHRPLFTDIRMTSNCLNELKETARIRLNMNTDWAFYRGDVVNGQAVNLDDSKWIPIALPHVMQLEKKHCGGNGIYDGIGWYRRYFKLPESYKGKRIVVSFEGVMTSCEVYVNGAKVAENYGGYIGLNADITDMIKWGESNVLAVKVSAQYDPLTPPGKPQGSMDFYYYSGIYRDVEMIVTNKLHVTDALSENIVAGGGVFVTYPVVDNKEAKVHVRTHIRNGHDRFRKGKLRTRLIDKNGKLVVEKEASFNLEAMRDCSLEQDLMVKNPLLWHPYHPDLYSLETQVLAGGKVVDEYTQQIGIRTIRYSTEDGFFINGEYLYMRGANRHQAYPNVGDAASNSMQERDVIDMKRGGMNAVRAAHYPQDPAFLAACDKYGLLVVECIPGWQYFNKDSVFIKRLFDVERGMIRRDRNHPSIVLWETALNESRYPVELAKEIQNIAHTEYPGSQMYTAGDYFGNSNMKDYYDVFYKQIASTREDGNVMNNHLEDQVAIKPLLTREWGDGVGEKPRVSLMENEEEQMKQCRSRFEQLNGNGYFDWCMLDANPRMAGHFVWSYNDYARGCCEETLFCGVVDINRYPKFSYYMMQSMRDQTISQSDLYDGPMVYVASYNASPSFASSTTDITVFSNCDSVRLYRNGTCIGTQTRAGRTSLYKPIVDKGGSPCFIFNAGSYEGGELKAEGLMEGKVVAVHRVRTPEQPHHIEVIVHDNGIAPVADGSDMIPVYFKVCDKNGTLVPTSDATIRISVSGEGTLIGDGIERVGISSQQVEGGVGFAFVRTTKKTGVITIQASGDGLAEGKTSVQSLKYEGTPLSDGAHNTFVGQEESGVTLKQTAWEKTILSKPVLPVKEVIVSGSQQEAYPASNVVDGDDKSWWIANEDRFPQVIMLTLKEPAFVSACRILFQKDSSSYRHKVEVSSDGVKWTTLYERECTGWDFKPQVVEKEIKYLRLTITHVSEGRAGLGEITLFGK